MRTIIKEYKGNVYINEEREVDMKRIGNLYPKIYDMENLKRAFQGAKRHKSNRRAVRWVEQDLDNKLLEIQQMLINKTFHTSQYTVFISKGKKERIIYKLPFFPDRIVQWAIILVIEEYLINSFIVDTYSAIPGRGIALGKERVQLAFKDTENCIYCLKIDIKHFYPSIDHDILKQKYRHKFKDKDLLWILDEIIDSVETATEEDILYLYGGNAPPAAHIGIPIGNYLSQYNGNFYLSDFDHWIKEIKHIKYYFRYMDDMVFISKYKEALQLLLQEIKDYLWQYNKLKLKNNYQIYPLNKRCLDFIGFKFYTNKTILLRKSTAKNMKKKIKKFDNNLNYTQWAGLRSYKSMCDNCNAYYLQQKYILPHMPNWVEYYINNIYNNKGGCYAYIRKNLCNHTA